MAPKKKSKKDKQELEEEAMAEWLARGHNIKDFSMDKMLAVWLEEDGDDDEDEGSLSAKQELIKGLSVLEPVVEQAKELIATMQETAQIEVSKALKTLWHYAEIPPLQRRRLLREHVVHVREMDREATKYVIVRQRVMDEWATAQRADKELAFGLKKRNVRQAPLLLRSREMKDNADREQHARLMEDMERTRRSRTDQELADKQRKRDAKEQLADAQRMYRRKMNSAFWQKQYVDAKQFAEQHSLASSLQRDAELAGKVQQMQAEIAAMDGEQAVDDSKALDRQATTSSLGVFGTALEPGEWNSLINGGHREGMDGHTVGLFSSRGFDTQNELLRSKCMDAQSKRMMLQEKLELVDHVQANLVADKMTVMERKNQLLVEIKQVNLEHDELGQLLAGPPRRDPTEEDKRHFHTLVTRRVAYMKKLHDLNAREANLQKRMELAARSASALQPLLVDAQAKEAELRRQVGEIDTKQIDLPVVIGRSIQRNAGKIAIPEQDALDSSVTVPLAHPARLYTQVTMESKLKLLENAAMPVKEHSKNIKQLAMEDWKTKELKALGEAELDVTKNRLGRLRDRLLGHQRDGLRADLMQAIHRYHQGSVKLRKCIFPLRGHIEWWQSQEPKRSAGLRFDETLRVMYLDPSVASGQVRGCVRLPKSGVFKICLSVRVLRRSSLGEWTFERAPTGETTTTSADPDQDVVDQACEKLTVFVGADYDALQELVFHDLGGKPLRAGSLSFEYYGARLCFCFDLTHRQGSQPHDTVYRLAVANDAMFEERLDDFREEESRMRLLQKEKHLLSQLVKTLRMQTKKTSSERCANLLQELVAVEKSKAKTWDSTLLHGYEQRFRRVDYAKMLRLEIKKELAVQIDQDVRHRQGRIHIAHEHSALDSLQDTQDFEDAGEHKIQRRDASRMEFLARKHALVEPQYLQSKESLGEYCSFKAPESNHSATYQKESIVMGLRLEWRQGKTKLHVMHKLYGLDENTMEANGAAARIKPTWCALESVNAVFLASACAKALQISRGEDAKACAVAVRKDEQVRQLHAETASAMQQQVDAEQREAMEDALLQKQKASELSRRAKRFYADAIRSTTYNAQVSAQVEFQAQRKKNALEQQQQQQPQADGRAVQWGDVLREVKEAYASKCVEGRLALVKKTWERKEKRLHDQREKQHRERTFVIHHEHTRSQEIDASNQRELEALHVDHAKRMHDQLTIRNFGAAVKGAFPCEHRELKAWGSKYDTGMRCKKCGKEMSKAVEEPDHARGVDAQLDRDVEQHRGQATGGLALRLRHPTHYEQVEQERVRLEKEAREIELCDALLYDRVDPKAIDAFNYRHNMNRHVDAVDGSDPMYQRTIQAAHHAAFQDEVLFHGRLKNFQFRIHQLTDLHAHTTTMLAVQKEFLANVQAENDCVLSQLPLVEHDHAKAVELMAQDQAALRALDAARKELNATRKERERAYYALEGTEEEAELAEFHAPSLVESSEQMTQIVERMRAQASSIVKETAKAETRLAMAVKHHAQTENILTRLQLRVRGTLLRTKYGNCRVLYYRDEDNCVVATADTWSATMYLPVAEIIAMEEADRERETAVMDDEDERMQAFAKAEHDKETQERALMADEEKNIHAIVAWRRKKEHEEELVRTTLCDEELAFQFDYETVHRKAMIQAATDEAKKLKQYTRVTLQHRSGPAKTMPPSRLDLLRVARASEKRMAMAAMEQALVTKDVAMRQCFRDERDTLFVVQQSGSLFEELVVHVVHELCTESVDEELHDLRQLHRMRNHGLVVETAALRSTAVAPVVLLPLHIDIKLDRLWWARKTKAVALYQAWSKEHAKLQALRLELARRDEIVRLQEDERHGLERRRKEMLSEERQCRKFYLDEMVQCMQERKAMASAEMEMREYGRLLEVEAMKAKYAKMLDDRNKANDKAARRLEIKLGKNEKHRLHREWAQIKLEDDLAMQLREQVLARAQAEALARQFDQFLAQQLADGKLAAEREAARVAERLHEQWRMAEEKRLAFEAKLVRERMMATVEAYYLQSRLELEWMQAVERTSFWRRKADLLRANLVPMEQELARILSEKDHVVADAQAKRSHAERCKLRAQQADDALHLAIQKEDDCAKQYRKIHFLNSTMDSAVLHGRPQRFRTVYLRDQLQMRYFTLLTESIIRRAIVECNEREAAQLLTKLRQIEAERAFKIQEIGVLQRKRRRHVHMQLKRSALGKLLFGKAQTRLLQQRFHQWVKLWSQRVVVRASFDVKHGLLMQQHRVRETHRQLANEDIYAKFTVLHQHQKRRVQCRLCKHEYTEEQNNRYACSFHPGAYELACVQSCATRQPAAAHAMPSANCMMHRARRWLCCDATDEGRYGSNGCATRFHLPVRANPALQALVQRKEQEEQTLLDQIQKQLQDLKDRDTRGRAMLETKQTVSKAEHELATRRARAAKFHTLDRR